MFIMFNPEQQRIPIKVWLPDTSYLDQTCLQQALNLANLPFATHVCLMPDAHQGFGMPIGGVLATDGYLIPNAVGVDIGCGVCYVQTDLKVATLTPLFQPVVTEILKSIPLGFKHHSKPQPVRAIEQFQNKSDCRQLVPELKAGRYQIGTLGGGNHFIELQKDEEGFLGVMVHTGSRNFGYKIAQYFNRKAKKLNQKHPVYVNPKWDLAFLPADSHEGQAYLEWMTLALQFAQENRWTIQEKVLTIFATLLPQYTDIQSFKRTLEVDSHHNYVALEQHFSQKLWVHRKGAIRVRKGELGLIPGAMGAHSYVVQGIGNPESLYSCSHGAGRKMGRREAAQTFSAQEVQQDLQKQGIIVGTKNPQGIVDEYRKAYKDIDFVLQNELDLVTPIKKLQTIAVVKGSD